MGDFASEEFRAIQDKVRRGGYDLELVLRVRNFKLPRPITWEKQKEQSWESVVEVINEAIQEAKETDDGCAALEKLCEVHGIGLPLASVLLAASDPEQFAIIDSKMFEFFQRGEDAYEKIKKIFRIDTDNEKLRDLLKRAEEDFDEISGKAYPIYLEILRVIKVITSVGDLREVEWNIWKELP
jgi:hypothetical protein